LDGASPYEVPMTRRAWPILLVALSASAELKKK
jgi:hypothetical protein